ncbi:MAG: hypothetical protein IJE45_00995 [Bacilli bacterium]|nr:hypothetical protein [Bacilli bacterium]
MLFLKYHLKKYPKMTNQDIIKLIYQETLGPNHIISDQNRVLNYLQKELEENHNLNNNLYEYIGTNYVRMDIHKYYQYFNSLDLFVDLFFKSLSLNQDLSLLKETLNNFLSKEDLKDYNYLPVSHSDIYRSSYLPHYRIIKSSLLTIEHKVIQLDNYLSLLPNKTIISLEGRCASGKSTITSKLKHKYTVIPIDDFFLPINLKTKERLNEIGGNINYELVKKMLVELKQALKRNLEVFSYSAFDCSKQEYYTKEIILKDKVILEGVYSASIYFRELIDKIAYLYVDKETQLKRINNRSLKEKFINEWIPLEEKYFEHILIEEISDIII